MSIAVIYCRVSTKEQVDNFSLPTQEKACRDYCKRHGVAVDKIFVEEGESAKTANRTQFQAMLAYCRENKGRVKWVVVYAVNRFARSSHDHLVTKNHLLTLGISLRSVTEPFDETSQGRLMESMLASFAQFDNDVRAERTVAGMKAAMQAGKWPFKAPLGYLNGETMNGGHSLIHDPERGPLVKQAFELYSTGRYTIPKLVEILSAAGLRTLKGKPVSKQTLHQLLAKPVYAGWLKVTSWGGEPVRGNFAPLVEQELFDAVQAVLSGKRAKLAPRLRSNPDFPLRHFVKCGCCGKPLTASWSKGRKERYGYYCCPNPKCRAVSVGKANLENCFAEYLQRMQPEERYVKLFNAIVLDVWKDKQAQNLALSATLKARIEELHGRMEQVEEAFLYKRTIDQSTYERQRDKLREQLALAEMQEHDAKLEGYDVEGVLAFAEQVILSAARLWMEASSDQKERLQKVLFPEGVMFANGEFGTNATCLLFSVLEKPVADESRLATLPGLEPGLPP